MPSVTGWGYLALTPWGVAAVIAFYQAWRLWRTDDEGEESPLAD